MGENKSQGSRRTRQKVGCAVALSGAPNLITHHYCIQASESCMGPAVPGLPKTYVPGPGQSGLHHRCRVPRLSCPHQGIKGILEMRTEVARSHIVTVVEMNLAAGSADGGWAWEAQMKSRETSPGHSTSNTHPFSSSLVGRGATPSEVDAAERAVLGSPGEKKPN